MTMHGTSLLDWILSLLRDPDARAAFQDDPHHYAAQYGFQDLSAADVHDALCLIADNASASYDHKFSEANDVHYPPPHHYQDGQDAAHYLNHYITNNYRIVDEHRTEIDNSVHERVDTHGGDFHQVIDNDPVATSGAGAVAAGGNVSDATVVSGHGNVAGYGNEAVTGDGGSMAFGSGDAERADFGHARFGDGGALSVGGAADGHAVDDDTTTNVHHSGSGATDVDAVGAHGYGAEFADQHESDSSGHGDYTDASRVDTHDELSSHDAARFDDGHDVDTHHA
jgi:hypothetical protein